MVGARGFRNLRPSGLRQKGPGYALERNPSTGRAARVVTDVDRLVGENVRRFRNAAGNENGSPSSVLGLASVHQQLQEVRRGGHETVPEWGPSLYGCVEIAGCFPDRAVRRAASQQDPLTALRPTHIPRMCKLCETRQSPRQNSQLMPGFSSHSRQPLK